jgi:hypothetical protein
LRASYSRLRLIGFEAEGVRLETGGAAVAYEEGSMGWVADEPTFYLPDGSAMKRDLPPCIGRKSVTGSWSTCTCPSACPTNDDESQCIVIERFRDSDSE